MTRSSKLRQPAAGLAAALFALTAGMAIAQVERGSEAPSPGDPEKTIPEKMAPASPGGEGRSSGESETLTEKLGRTGGVIKPPDDIAPGMNVPAPVPNPGTTPVIPPPGSPGSGSGVQPK